MRLLLKEIHANPSLASVEHVQRDARLMPEMVLERKFLKESELTITVDEKSLQYLQQTLKPTAMEDEVHKKKIRAKSLDSKGFISRMQTWGLPENDVVITQLHLDQQLTSDLLPALPSFRSLFLDTLLPCTAIRSNISIAFTPQRRMFVQILVMVLCILTLYKAGKTSFNIQRSSYSSEQFEEIYCNVSNSLNDSIPVGDVDCKDRLSQGILLEERINNLIQVVGSKLNFTPDEKSMLFLQRLLFSVMKEDSNRQRKTKRDLLFREELSSRTRLYEMNANKEKTVKSISSEGLSVLEVFSGIGGMRLALPKTIRGFRINSITAIDVNRVANQVYDYNFHNKKIDAIPHSTLKTFTVEALHVEDVDDKYDIWTMSPPCQPFTTTKNAQRKDELDARSKGFQHIIHILSQLKFSIIRKPPRWIVLENVKGFIDSSMYQLFLAALAACHYRVEEFLISPDTSLQIPNSRSRYYLIAEHDGAVNTDPISGKILTQLPTDVWKKYTMKLVESNVSPPITVGEMLLQRLTQAEIEAYNNLPQLLPSQSHIKKEALSIVSLSSQRTRCFTKGYGSFLHKSTGSLLHRPQQSESRLFHPDELLAIFGFPSVFQFPLTCASSHSDDRQYVGREELTIQQCYACIGNSVNVRVVQAVMDVLFHHGERKEMCFN